MSKLAVLVVLAAVVATVSVNLSAGAALAAERTYGEGSFADRVNAFGADLFVRAAGAPGDVFLSPYSAASALCMAGLGARGATREELSVALRMNLVRPAVHAGHRSLREALERGAAAGGYELAAANRLFGRAGARVEPAFLEAVRASYGGGFEQVDFAGAAEAARAHVNEWVLAQTRQRIRDLLQPGDVSAETRLVLVNALYFKGLWELAFEHAATAPAPFERAPGRTADVPTMRSLATRPYAEDDLMQAVELPYRGGDLAMVVVLPRARHGLPDLVQALAERGLAWPAKALTPREVDVHLPRFKLAARYELGAPLQAMGVRAAFDAAAADFSGLTGDRSTSVSKVVQQTFVEVTEEGTEAAAATAVVMTDGCAAQDPPPPVVFRADQPFLFWIRDRRSGVALFVGRVADPAAL